MRTLHVQKLGEVFRRMHLLILETVVHRPEALLLQRGFHSDSSCFIEKKNLSPADLHLIHKRFVQPLQPQWFITSTSCQKVGSIFLLSSGCFYPPARRAWPDLRLSLGVWWEQGGVGDLGAWQETNHRRTDLFVAWTLQGFGGWGSCRGDHQFTWTPAGFS